MMPLLVRVDGSSQIGTGHVMRCLALAQEWQRAGGPVLFAVVETTPALEQRLRREGIEVVRLPGKPGSAEDAAQTVALAGQAGAAWMIADSYAFGADWQHRVKESGARLLLWDDYGHAEHYYADLVLNQNLSADAALYARREPYTHLLLGPRYAQLRHEFLEWRGWRREIPAVARKVLVTLGGSDPDNVTGKVLQAIRLLPEIEAVVVVGGSNPNLDSLKSDISNLKSNVRLVVDVPHMPELMAWADVAVSAAGATTWELLFMGLPTLALQLADNQATIAVQIERESLGKSLGHHGRVTAEVIRQSLSTSLMDFDGRQGMSRRGRERVDGCGARRVVTRLRADSITLRRAVAEDCRRVWECANHPTVRAGSFTADPIPWAEHVRWYAERLRDSNCFFYIALNRKGQPIGQIRFQLTGTEATLSVSLAPDYQRHGHGAPLIFRGTEQFFADAEAGTVHAYVKLDNEVSFRVFEKADFEDRGATTMKGQPARHFVRRKEPV